ncbi:MAG: diguanylate cyclase [Arcobacter sp.]|nr:MAG: diguanylate cyclase [Arcobacter sp.]
MFVKHKYVYESLHKQIPIIIGLSMLPGLGYIFLGWLNHIVLPALIWYGLVSLLSIWGLSLYKSFDYDSMTSLELISWHNYISKFYLLMFSSWALIFILYGGETESKMHYIAIFTELGAAVVASTLLFSDRKVLIPILLVLMLPLSAYFLLIHEFYAYVLSLFSLVFMGVLFYSAHSSDKLLEKTQYQASHDQLTKLFNRHSFIDTLQRKVNELEKHQNYSYLLLIDLDHFKTVNDSLGHDVGDKLLEEVALRLKDIAKDENIIARLGGDEFVLLGKGFIDSDKCISHAMRLSNELLQSLKNVYSIEPHNLYLSASIGVSLLSPQCLNANTFIKEADIAMYEVKEKGRDGVILFNDKLSKRVESHLKIEHRLHSALKNNEIYLHYQPQLNIKQEIIGCEVLVRWKNEDLGVVPPDVFIPIAEQIGYMVPLGEFILEEAFKTFKKWNEEGLILEQFSINISMRQLFHYSFVLDVGRMCQKYLNEDLQKKIIFEVTETILAEDMNKVVSVMNSIRKYLDIRFSMDDFGTGYSSLSYLQKLPINELKIDRSFISELSKDKNDQEIVLTILAMAKTFGLKVVAEGVETREHYEFLKKNNCDILQGYYYSKPLDKDDFESYMRHNRFSL